MASFIWQSLKNKSIAPHGQSACGLKAGRTSEPSLIRRPIILLTMVDITQMTVIAAELADYANRIEKRMNERTKKLEVEVKQLKKEVGDMKTDSHKHGKVRK